MKNNIERIVHSSFHKKGKGRKALPSLALLPLLGCGAEEIPVETVEEIQEQSPTISDGKNYFDLVVSIANTGSIDETDIITATNETFISATSLIDENPAPKLRNTDQQFHAPMFQPISLQSLQPF